ncbi:MAG: glycosyltransferase family 4 protein [Candidatus Methanoperedens sp.]|nr:glycosyltransferase family 4 protein [Candidatus Methanoperedens sp.]
MSDWYYPGIGGIENHIEYLAGQLVELGNEVHILTCGNKELQDKIGEHDALKREMGITVHRIKGYTIKKWGAVVDPRISWIVNDVIKKENFDLIHAHSIYSPTAMVTAYVGKTLRNIPTLATNHSIWGEWRLGSLFQRTIREEFTRLDAIIAVSSAVKKDMERFCIDNPVFIIPGGVDCDRFYPDAKCREETRKLLGYGDNAIVIVTVGRLVPRKRMHELIQIMPYLTNQHNVKLLIVGDGPEKKKLINLSKSLKVNQHVKFVGFSHDPRNYLNASDIFALCSVEEALGLSILEAMACELPVAVKNVNGISDILDGNGILPYALDADGIKNNVEFLINNVEIRSKLGKNNRKHVLANFAWDGICEKTIGVYDFIEQTAEMDSNKYYNMKLAKIGRIAKRLMRFHEKNSKLNDRY